VTVVEPPAAPAPELAPPATKRVPYVSADIVCALKSEVLWVQVIVSVDDARTPEAPAVM